MGNKYQQLTIEERCEIARLRTAGHSQRQIAASLDRAPSTVARELKRNSSRTRGYQPSYAQQQARVRRWSGSRLERDASLRQQVLAGLTQAWSPEQAADRQVSSHESSYRFIYAQLARKKEYSWRRYLPGPSSNGATGDAGVAAQPPSSPSAGPRANGPRQSR